METTSESSGNSVLTSAPPPEVPVEKPNETTSTSTKTQDADLGNAPQVKLALEKDWYKQLPEELRDEPVLKNFADVASLAKSLIHAQRAVGAEKVALPGKHATEDDWKMFFNKIGVPEKFDDYKLDFKDTEIAGQEKELFDKFRETAHKLGILPKQATELWKWNKELTTQMQDQMRDAHKEAVESGINELKREWGKGYDKEVRKAVLALKRFGDDEVAKVFDETGLGNNPKVIKLFNKIGNMLSEDVLKGQELPQGRTPKEINNEINSIIGNREAPYHVRNHPNHAKQVQYVNDLFSQLAEMESEQDA